MRREKFPVQLSEEGMRLGTLLVRRLPAVSRRRLDALLRQGKVKVAGGAAKDPDLTLEAGWTIDVSVPGDLGNSPKHFLLLDRAVLAQSEGFVAVDKPASVKVHRNHPKETVTTLTEAVAALAGDGLLLAHRLDRATSGVVVFARGKEAAAHLGRQFARRKVEKTYLALVEGVPRDDEGVLDAALRRIGGVVRIDPEKGKPARTRWKVLGRGPRHALVELYPETGRTHQLRAHMASLGYPLVGDLLYGGRLGVRRSGPKAKVLDLGGALLHCASLAFADPVGGATVRVRARLPEHFAAALEVAQVERGAPPPKEEPVSPGAAAARPGGSGRRPRTRRPGQRAAKPRTRRSRRRGPRRPA